VAIFIGNMGFQAFVKTISPCPTRKEAEQRERKLRELWDTFVARSKDVVRPISISSWSAG
jgi:hypothetical protein